MSKPIPTWATRCAVRVNSTADFLAHYYKPDRYRGRGQQYADSLLNSYEQEVKENGYTFISHHDSANGRLVAYIPGENNG
jgi:hypothetical protein